MVTMELFRGPSRGTISTYREGGTTEDFLDLYSRLVASLVKVDLGASLLAPSLLNVVFEIDDDSGLADAAPLDFVGSL